MAQCRNVKVSSFFHLFLSTSTIHGLNHTANRKRHVSERLFWCCLVFASVFWVCRLGRMALIRYLRNPTVISMERDRFSWNTTFPASTLCPKKKINDALLENYVSGAAAKNRTALRDFLIALSQATYGTFDKVPLYDEMPPENYIEVLSELQLFSSNITCPDTRNVKCELQRSVTEMGICYSFNSQLAVYNSLE